MLKSTKAKSFIILFLMSLPLIHYLHMEPRADSRLRERVSLNNGLIVSQIFIDGSNPLYNWSTTALANSWCYGEGTLSKPYIIENITINGNGGTCIEIHNSNVPFIIRNCTFTNYTFGVYSMKLIAVNRGLIYQNNLSDIYSGLWLELSHNNTISQNHFITDSKVKNHGHLILLKSSNFNNISNNKFNNTGNKAIALSEHCDNNLISHNEVNNTGGIAVSSWSDNNNITNNFLDSGEISLYLTDNIKVSNNILRNSNLYFSGISNCIIIENQITEGGVNIEVTIDKSNVIDTSNTINSKPFYYYNEEVGLQSNNFTNAGQIILVGCNDSIIRGLNLSRCFKGVILHYCNNISITNSDLSNNYMGIDMFLSNNNNISQNEIDNVSRGISVRGTLNFISHNRITKSLDRALFIYWNSNNNTISYNNISYGEDDAIYLMDRSSHNIIHGNKIQHCKQNGILLDDDCDFNNISMNFIYNNSFSGIKIISSNSDNNKIYNNIITENSEGISLEHSYYNIISNNNIIDSELFGIVLDNSPINYLSNNHLNKCGIHLKGYLASFNLELIDTSNLINGKPFYMYINETFLSSNNFHNAGQIILINCNYSTISDVVLSKCSIGISLYYCYHSHISNLNVSYNAYFGIYSVYCHNITITKCKISNNQISIQIQENSLCKVSNVDLINNIHSFIASSSSHNIFSNNFVYNNSCGIELYYNSHNNSFFNNILTNNTQKGVFIDTNCNYSYFFNNTLRNSLGINAIDNGGRSKWDNGNIGNFWSNYTGKDVNDDGIGDTPFFIRGNGGSVDNFPLWDDGDDTKPIIIIVAPQNNTDHGKTAPYFNIEIVDISVDIMWYTLDNGNTNFTIIENGTIDQDFWDSLDEGPVSLRFFVNDTAGNTVSQSIALIKDTISPLITIISPNDGDVFKNTSPNFEISITETNLESFWFSIDGGATNISIDVLIGTIDQSVWGSMPNGNITLIFYARDFTGNVGYNTVILKKVSETTIKGYNLVLIFSAMGLTALILIAQRKLKKLI